LQFAERWKPCQTLWNKASKVIASIGEVLLSRSSTQKTFLYVVKEKSKGSKALAKEGKRRVLSLFFLLAKW
jgi:hypothetical protein